MGCGPAEIIDYMPDCNYYGYDIDERSIRYAKKTTQIKITIFFCKEFRKKRLKNYQNLIL